MGLTRAALIGAFALVSAPALAQPHDHDKDKDHDRGHHDDHGPRLAPPAPQAENHGVKAGFEWIPGRWDWKAEKWAWTRGRWEKEHPGQHWREGRWEARGATWAYVEGEWAAAGAPPPPVGGPPGPMSPPGEDHHHEWKIDRPVVSSYWPARGKPGAHVVIRGRNFPPDIEVMWAGTHVAAAKIKPEEIVFDIPAGAATGEIVLHREHGRALPVGQFEVVATGDPEAEARKLDDERHKQAEQEWAARQHELAKDRAAREAAEVKQDQELDTTREQRREARIAELRAKWDAAFLADPDTQAELTLHAQRVAELARAKEVAELKADGKLAVRVDVATSRENDRHDQRMTALKAGFGAKGATP